MGLTPEHMHTRHPKIDDRVEKCRKYLQDLDWSEWRVLPEVRDRILKRITTVIGSAGSARVRRHIEGYATEELTALHICEAVACEYEDTQTTVQEVFQQIAAEINEVMSTDIWRQMSEACAGEAGSKSLEKALEQAGMSAKDTIEQALGISVKAVAHMRGNSRTPTPSPAPQAPQNPAPSPDTSNPTACQKSYGM